VRSHVPGEKHGVKSSRGGRRGAGREGKGQRGARRGRCGLAAESSLKGGGLAAREWRLAPRFSQDCPRSEVRTQMCLRQLACSWVGTGEPLVQDPGLDPAEGRAPLSCTGEAPVYPRHYAGLPRFTVCKVTLLTLTLSSVQSSPPQRNYNLRMGAGTEGRRMMMMCEDARQTHKLVGAAPLKGASVVLGQRFFSLQDNKKKKDECEEGQKRGAVVWAASRGGVSILWPERAHAQGKRRGASLHRSEERGERTEEGDPPSLSYAGASRACTLHTNSPLLNSDQRQAVCHSLSS